MKLWPICNCSVFLTYNCSFLIFAFENCLQVTVSRLPDQGAKLHRQILELNSELQKMRMEQGTEKKVIDLDDLTGDFRRVMNV